MSVRILGAQNNIALIHAINYYISSPEPMKALCKEAVEIIKKRTLAGISPRGGGFVPLKPSYRLWKTSFGRSGIPDMLLMGDLLDAIKIEIVTAKHGKIFVAPNPQSRPSGGTAKIKTDTLANVHHYGRASINMPARPFFDLSENEIKMLSDKYYNSPIREIIRKHAGAQFGERGTR